MTELKKMNIKAYRSINMRKCDPPPKKNSKVPKNPTESKAD